MRNTAKGTSTRTNKKTKPVKRNTSIPLSLVLQNLSSNIEYLLKINNMDKSEFASYLGMTHQTLSKYLVAKDDFSERLPAPMPLRKLIAAAEILGVTPDALIYHDLEKKDRASYAQDIASMLQRPTSIPECTLRRYCNRKWYMYYYTIKDGSPKLCEAHINSMDDFKLQYIKATVSTESHTHHMKMVADYPRYIYLYGINAQNPTRFFITFSDPDYTIDSDFVGGLAICVSIIPESKDGLPGMQFVALSTKKLDLEKHENQLHDFLTVPSRSRMLRLHPEQNKMYIDWLLRQSPS